MAHHTGSAWGRLRATPGFTAIALLSLALGVGLNILVFAITSPVLVKGLPYPESDRLLDVTMAPPGRPEARSPLTAGLYFLLRDKAGAAFEAIGVYDAGRTANLAGDATGLAERLNAHRISATGLAALGAQPIVGRLPVAADEQPGAEPTVVLGYALWQKRFSGRADVVNQTVSVDGQPTKVIGVMPEGFGLLDNNSDAWFTSGFEPAPGQETQKNLRGVGRLKPGASMADAQAAVKVALDEYAAQFPTRDRGWTVELTPWRQARFGGLRQPLLYAQMAVGAMLLLLCVNLSVWLRARTAAMPGTPAATSSRSVFADSLFLALGGGALGALLVAVGLPTLLELMPRVLPRLDEVGLNPSVLAFGVLLCVAAAFVMAFVPALRITRPIATGTPGSSGSIVAGQLSATAIIVLLAVQMTLAFVLLAGAGLGIRAYGDLHGRDIGVDPAGLVAADVYLPRGPYVTPNVAKAGAIDLSDYNPAGAAVFDRVRVALQSMPGAVQAAAVGSQPFGSAPFAQFFIDDAEQSPDNQLSGQFLTVTENYFNTMGIRIVKGRDFSANDRPDSPWAVLVNETLARQQWPDSEALGHRLTLTFHPEDFEPAREVIGVVADTLPFKGASEVPPLIYVLHRQQSVQQRTSIEPRRTVMTFIVRAPGQASAVGENIRAAVAKVEQTTPVANVRTVESYANGGQVQLFRFVAALLGVFAVVALVSVAVGVYGLTVYGVAQRRRVLTLILRMAVVSLVGVAAGRYVWVQLGSVIESFLTNLAVTPTDPATLTVALVVAKMALLPALFGPALRWMKAGR